MFRVALALLLVAAAFAQTAPPPAEKPPAGVDQALRARVTEFYSLMKSREYRKAEGLIADDTKDYYYNGSKPAIKQFEVLDVEWSDGFTHARVTTRCTEAVMIPGFPVGDVSLNLPSTWRLESGTWYLFVDQSKMFSPVGLQFKDHPGPAPAGMPKDIPQTAGFVMGKLQADKQTVRLAPGETEQVTLINGSAGIVSLEPGYPPKGIEVTLDRADVGHGEKAILTLKAGKEPTPGVYSLRVVPTQETISIDVQVK